MLTAIHHMLKDGTEHQDLGPDHFDRRSTDLKAKRLVAQLAKLGFHAELHPIAGCVVQSGPCSVKPNPPLIQHVSC
jgi:hypothetical protein